MQAFLIQKFLEVRNQCALAKKTSQIMKNGQDVIIQMGSGTLLKIEQTHPASCTIPASVK